MFGLDSLTHITLSHMGSDVSFQSIPPILLLQILIHLSATRVDRIVRIMGFLQYSLPEAINLWNTYPIFEPYGTLPILREFWNSTFSNKILNLLNFSILQGASTGLTNMLPAIIFLVACFLEMCIRDREMAMATDLFVLCVKMVSVDKLLENR